MTVFRIVLIETYWNVKKVKPKILLSFDMVLIETYWNVKVLSAGGSGAQTGINRNILECKGVSSLRIG